METTRCALIFLVSACLWRESCTSSIELCMDSSTSFDNGTAIPAILGKPVSVVFCVQCEPSLEISPYSKIKLPSEATYPTYYYPNNRRESSPFTVNITPSANKATVNITIKTVQKEHFTNQFYVKINTNKNVSDNSVFVFHLTDASISGTTPSDASLILSTQPMMPAATSISSTSPTSSSRELSTVTSQASTASTSTSSPTQELTQCWPGKTSLCPGNWYQVDNETCLLVSYNESPNTVCKGDGSKPVTRKDIEKYRSCLIEILGASKAASNNDVVRVDNKHYVNVHSGTDVARTHTYSVVCVNRTFKSPTVSLLSLHIPDKPGWSLVDNSIDDVTVNTTYVDVRVTCTAEGVPTPGVIVTAEGGPKRNPKITTGASRHQITYEALFRLANCSQAGVYTCTANNSLGTTRAHRRIRNFSSLKFKMSQFTANNKKDRLEIESGGTVKLKCSVDGCPDKVTITRNEHSIAEMTNYTLPLVHEIKDVNCSHMGIYTCLAKPPNGQDVQETASLEVKGCPVSLCESKDTSREISSILGDNVKFSLCLMSSEEMKSLANDPRIVIKFTRNHITRFYWTANITLYNIQVMDYRTHTIRIGNGYGSLDVQFTLKDKGSAGTPVGQKAEGHESESSALLIALPPVCFIILVFIIVGIVWYRVKGTRISRTRSEEVIDHGSGNDDSGEVTYANLTSVGRVPEGQEAEHEEDSNSTDLHGKESGRFITADGLVYITVVNANKQINKRSQGGKHSSKLKCDDEGRVEYITLDFEKTGKLLVADEEDSKDDDSGEKMDTRQ